MTCVSSLHWSQKTCVYIYTNNPVSTSATLTIIIVIFSAFLDRATCQRELYGSMQSCKWFLVAYSSLWCTMQGLELNSPGLWTWLEPSKWRKCLIETWFSQIWLNPNREFLFYLNTEMEAETIFCRNKHIHIWAPEHMGIQKSAILSSKTEKRGGTANSIHGSYYFTCVSLCGQPRSGIC